MHACEIFYNLVMCNCSNFQGIFYLFIYILLFSFLFVDIWQVLLTFSEVYLSKICVFIAFFFYVIISFTLVQEVKKKLHSMLEYER